MAATFITITNTTTSNVSFEGDGGIPRVKVPANDSITVQMYEVSGNEDFCTNLSTFVTAGTLVVTRGSNTLTAAQISEFAYAGDMYKSEYDADDNAVVDESEELEYTNRTQVDDTMTPYTVLATDKLIETDTTGGVLNLLLPAGVDGKQYFVKDIAGTALGNNVTITANGVETIEGAATTTLVANYQSVILYYDAASTDWKIVGYSTVDPAVVALNTAHRTGDGSDHADVATNTGRTDDWLDGQFPIRATADHTAPYVPLAADVLIGCTSAGGAVAVNLNTLATYANNKMLVIKDEGGNAGVANITVTPNGAETIDGVNAPVVINVAYGVLRLYKIAGGWLTW